MIDYSEVSKKMNLFAGQVYSACGLGTWCFNGREHLHYTTYPYEKEFLMFLSISGCLDYIIKNVRETRKLCILSDDIGFIWIADGLWEKGKLNLLYLLGPIFLSNTSLKDIEASLENMHFQQSDKKSLIQVLQKVPVLTVTMLDHYASMLHYTITEKIMKTEDFHYQNPFGIKSKTKVTRKEKVTESETFEILQEAYLQCIREGNLNYEQFFQREIQKVSVGGAPFSSVREMKNTFIIFAALCSRAAIEGGLSPKLARKMESYYIDRIEKTMNLDELSRNQDKMLTDFVTRVNQLKAKSHASDSVQHAINYIQDNLTKDIDISEVAKEVGYTKYYFTKKFFNEMNISLNDYIKEARVEHAKILLITTNRSIQEISEEFHFSTRTYFSKVFREKVGMTPLDYREKMKNLVKHEGDTSHET